MADVTALKHVQTQSLGWNRTPMTFMGRFALCSLQLITTNLRRIAAALKAGVEERPNYRPIRRFLAEYSVVSGCFLISSGDPPVLLDPAEEPLDLISVCIQVAIDFPLDESVFPRWNYNNRL